VPRIVVRLLEGEDYQECCPFTNFAGYSDPTVMFLGDPAYQ